MYIYIYIYIYACVCVFLYYFVNLRVRNKVNSVLPLLVTGNVFPSSLILFALMMRQHVLSKRQFSQEPHGVTSQKAPLLKTLGGLVSIQQFAFPDKFTFNHSLHIH
jgi:hypothetical protein